MSRAIARISSNCFGASGLAPRALRDPLGERRPFDELEDERVHAAGRFHPVDGRYVRMVQRGERERLAAKPRDSLGIGGERRG